MSDLTTIPQPAIPPWKLALLGLAVAFALFMRLALLDGDAPEWLDWSVGIWTDEAIYAQNAWNHVHTGRWLLDEFAPMAVTPVQTLLDRAMYGLLGPTVWALRLLAVTLGTVGSALLVAGVWRTAGRAVGTAALLVVALDPSLAHFNRLALNETTMFPVLAGILWLAGERTSRLRLAAAGVLSALAFLVKPFGLIAAPIVLLALLLDRALDPSAPWKQLLSRAFAFGTPLAAGLGAALVFGYLPHREVVDRMLHYFGAGKVGSVGEDLYRNFFHDDFVQRFPLPSLGVLLAVGLLRVDDLRKSSALRLWTAWLACTGLYLASLNYNAIRYYFVALPAVFALAAWALETAWREPERLHSRRFAVILVVPVVHRALRLAFLPHTFYGVGSQARGFAVTGTLALIGVVLWMRRGRDPQPAKWAALAAVALLVLGWNVRRGIQAVATMEHGLRSTAQELRAHGVDGPIAGDWAVALQTHLDLPAHRVARGILNVPSTWRGLGIRWFLGPREEFAALAGDEASLRCWQEVAPIVVHGRQLVLVHAGDACDAPTAGHD